MTTFTTYTKTEAIELFNEYLIERDGPCMTENELAHMGFDFQDGMTWKEIKEWAVDFLDDLHTQRSERFSGYYYE